MDRARLTVLAARLERVVIGFALAALAFRATLYWRLPPAAGARYGSGDVIDYALGLVLFLIACACAGCAVALNINASDAERAAAWRPAVVGMTTFVVYYLLQPHVPRLL